MNAPKKPWTLNLHVLAVFYGMLTFEFSEYTPEVSSSLTATRVSGDVHNKSLDSHALLLRLASENNGSLFLLHHHKILQGFGLCKLLPLIKTLSAYNFNP